MLTESLKTANQKLEELGYTTSTIYDAINEKEESITELMAKVKEALGV